MPAAGTIDGDTKHEIRETISDELRLTSDESQKEVSGKLQVTCSQAAKSAKSVDGTRSDGMVGTPWRALWRSRKFWLAVVAVVQTVIFTLLPDFPDEVWQAINIILLWLIGTIAVEDAASKIRDTKDEIRN
jgi:hypothetical protein